MAPEKAKALRLAVASTGREVLDYVERFRRQIPDDVVNSQEYSFRVFLVPKVANRPGSADAAVEFVPYDADSPEEMEELKKLTALIKERHVPVANLDLFKPGQVVAKVKAGIPHAFNPNLHARAWQHYGVRPPGKSERPERTKSQYCVYDKAHADYLYTQAWVEFLTRELKEADKYEEVVGKAPAKPV